MNGKKPPPSYAPIYAALYPQLAEIARNHGYALAVHGSLQRDFDLIAVPWSSEISRPEELVEDIFNQFEFYTIGEPTEKEHGRIAYTLHIAFGECAVDLSFTPIDNERE